MNLELLVPLGLLGLLGIVALIVIYIIRPNYIVRRVPSSYVWKLSLRYRKRRLPTSRIRNILVFICQILILASIAAILAMPVLREEGKETEYDVIAVIDSSASMYAGEDGDSRFLRAVDGVAELSESVFASKGNFSVILADDEPSYLVRRISSGARAELENSLAGLRENEYACYFGSSDIDAAMQLCEEVLTDNPAADIYLFTDTVYNYVPEGVEVVSVADEKEWNAAILNATATLEDNYYTVTVQVASYGRDSMLDVDVTVNGANSFEGNSGSTVSVSKTVMCDAGSVKTVIFRDSVVEETDDVFYYAMGAQERFYSYKAIQVSLGEADSFPVDNNYYLYGGQKEAVKVQYASSLPNPFFTGALDVLRNAYASRWDLQVTEVNSEDVPATEGFDFYIFEHTMPETVPTDGVVFLVDPKDGVPTGSGLRWMGESDFNRESIALTAGETHPVTQNIVADNLTVSRIVSLSCDETYSVLLTCDTKPVLLTKKDGAMQIAVMAFSIHYSNIAELPEFYLLLYNLFGYYLPATVEANTFEVGEEVTVNSRGPVVNVSDREDALDEFPAKLVFGLPGTYTVTPSSYFERALQPVEIYIKIPAIESNTSRTEDSFTEPYREPIGDVRYDDLLIYLAAALLFLLAAEWALQWRGSM